MELKVGKRYLIGDIYGLGEVTVVEISPSGRFRKLQWKDGSVTWESIESLRIVLEELS